MAPDKKIPSSADSGLAEYRQWLVAAEQKTQDDFDKTVLSLSGGALGISFVFLKDVVGENPLQSPAWLLMAWIAWALSIISVLASFYLSHLALRQAIQQVDKKTIRNSTPGGKYAIATAFLNAAGAILFLIGVCFITTFAGMNLYYKETLEMTSKRPTTPPPRITPPKPPTPTPLDKGTRTPGKPLTEGYIPPPPPPSPNKK